MAENTIDTNAADTAADTVADTKGMDRSVPVPHLLVIEDDEQLNTGLKLYLESQEFEVTCVTNGEDGLREIMSLPGYALVLLDAKLPRRSGFDVLREMRKEGVETPVLILSGLGSHDDKMRGFELGADDYLTKPFSTEELVARIRAILRRGDAGEEEAQGTYDVGGLAVDLSNGDVQRDEDDVKLTDLEFKLLKYLILHRGRTVSREQLLRDVWELPSEVETRTIDRHVNALRKVMEGDGEDTWPIQSVYGIGYKLIGVARVDDAE